MRFRWWHWPLAALGLLVVAILVVYAVGATLPVEHTATVEAEIDAPPAAVWELITDVEHYPGWRPDVDSVRRLDDRDGLPAWQEAAGGGALTFETVAREPGQRLVVRIADEGLPFAGTWTYRVEPAGSGTRLTITEEGEVYSPLFRFMSRYLFGHEATIRAYLDAVRTELSGAGG